MTIALYKITFTTTITITAVHYSQLIVFAGFSLNITFSFHDCDNDDVEDYTYANPLKLGSADMRQISSQLLSDSHVLSVGFGSMFCRPTPPVKKNSSSSWSRSPFALYAKASDR